MYEWAAKVDEYARGMIGPLGSTLFEELGLYYIGPVDGHNIEDLICVLNQVASLDSTGPVLVHVITKEDKVVPNEKPIGISNKYKEGIKSFVLKTVIKTKYLVFFVSSYMKQILMRWTHNRVIIPKLIVTDLQRL